MYFCQLLPSVGVVLVALISIAVCQDDEGECTNSRAGQPVCLFRKDITCGWRSPSKNLKLAWTFSTGDTPFKKPTGPTGEQTYIYIDKNAMTPGSTNILDSPHIDSKTKAICVEFHYATSGTEDATIQLRLWADKKYTLMHEVVAKTSGEWMSSNFTCCLPKILIRDLSLKATPPQDGAVGVYFMDVRKSNMSCEDGQLKCYPAPPTPAPPTSTTTSPLPITTTTTAAPVNLKTTTPVPKPDLQTTAVERQTTVPTTEAATITMQTTVKATTATIKPSNQDDIESTTQRQTTTPESTPTSTAKSRDSNDTATPTLLPGLTCSGDLQPGIPSCEFGSDNDGASLCGWRFSEEGTSQNNTFDDGIFHLKTKQAIRAAISAEVESVCMEVQFLTDDPQQDIEGLFDIRVYGGNQSIVWGESYDYTQSDDRVWKRNSFVGCLGTGEGRELEITLVTSSIKIDYIKFRTANITCGGAKTENTTIPTTIPTSKPTSGKTLFSCSSPTSSSSSSSFCGLSFSSSSSENTSSSVWREITDKRDQYNIFKGESYYILFDGNSTDLETPASLATPVLESPQKAAITFSYILVGNSEVRVSIEKGVSSAERQVLWTTHIETGAEWTDITVLVNVTGSYKVIFEVVGINHGMETNEGVQVGIADISVVERQESDPEQKPDGSGKGDAAKSKSSGSGNSDNVGVIVGSVIGCLVFVALVAGALWWWKIKRGSSGESRYVMTSVRLNSEVTSIENAVYNP